MMVFAMTVRESTKTQENRWRRLRLQEEDRTPPPPPPPAPTTTTAAPEAPAFRPSDATVRDARQRLTQDPSFNFLAFRLQNDLDARDTDQTAADEAVATIREEFSEDVDQDDLEHISEVWAGLTPEQAQAAFDELTDDEIDKWGSEAQRSTFWTDNGLTGNQQQALFDDLATKLTADQLKEVAVAFDNRGRMEDAVREHAPSEVRTEYLAGAPSDPITVLNLNVSGGHGNKPYDSDGMDPGDIDELATRIIEGDADVATLQEVWEQDLPALERELEERTGDEWDLHFAEASKKVRFDDDLFATAHLNQPFGNAVLVRRGEGVAYSEIAGREKIDSPGDVGDGSDGRSAIAVRVHTADGGSFVVATAHTDTAGDIADPEERAREIAEVRRFAEGVAGDDPVVVTGDFNAVIDGDDATAEALQDYVDAGYADAGDIGPTSDFGSGRRIDFVFTGEGIIAGDPERLDGDSPDHEGQDADLADHDGILVDISVPTDGEGIDPDDIPEGSDFERGQGGVDDDYR